MSHIDFLDKCLQHSQIPVGFSMNWQVDLDMDMDLSVKCDSIKRDASLKLIQLTTEACKRKAESLDEDIEQQNTRVRDDRRDMSNVWERREATRMKRVKQMKWKKMVQRGTADYVTVPVKSDGNCFYRCVSMWLYGTEDEHTTIRTEITTFMTDNKDKFQCLVDGSMDVHIRDQRFTDGRESSWATEAEMCAASVIYKVNVKVTTNTIVNPIQWSTHTLRVDSGSHSGNCIPYDKSMHLILQHDHFNFLRINASNVGVVQGDTIGPDQYGVQVNTAKVIDWFECDGVSRTDGRKQPMHSPSPRSTNTKVDVTPDECTSMRSNGQERQPELVKRRENKSETVKRDRLQSKVHTFEQTPRLRNKPNATATPAKPPKGVNESVVTNLSDNTLTEAETSLLSKA